MCFQSRSIIFIRSLCEKVIVGVILIALDSGRPGNQYWKHHEHERESEVRKSTQMAYRTIQAHLYLVHLWLSRVEILPSKVVLIRRRHEPSDAQKRERFQLADKTVPVDARSRTKRVSHRINYLSPAHYASSRVDNGSLLLSAEETEEEKEQKQDQDEVWRLLSSEITHTSDQRSVTWIVKS